MNHKLTIALWTLALFPARAQPDNVAALKQSLAENQQLLRQLQWVETTVVTMKGEEKSIVQKLCFYGPDGTVQKQEINASPQQQTPGGLKAKVISKKKAEIDEYMRQAVALVHQYIPPDPMKIQAAKAVGNPSARPAGSGSIQLAFSDFVKPGDALTFNLDAANNAIQKLNVKSYLDSKKDSVGLDVTFAMGNDGMNYPANIILVAPAKQIEVIVQNSNYKPAGSASRSR
jgi:hypothetical protein